MADWFGWRPATEGWREKKWAWHGEEAGLIQAVAPVLRARGFKLAFEIHLIQGGRLDIVAWDDRQVVFLEAKCLRRLRPGHRADSGYRDAMAGIGQLLFYREIVERHPGGWFTMVDPDLLAYGGSLWAGGVLPARWVLLLATADPAKHELVEAVAGRVGIETWYWTPACELTFGNGLRDDVATGGEELSLQHG